MVILLELLFVEMAIIDNYENSHNYENYVKASHIRLVRIMDVFF